MMIEALTIDENVQKLSDKVLLLQAEKLAGRGREITVLILQHLREIEIRRLYIGPECSSMHKYCIKTLKFSESETQSLLASARLMISVPEIEEKIQEGSLSVTSLSMIQSFFNAERKVHGELNKEAKLEIIQQLENKSTRAVKQELISQSSQPALLATKFKCSLGEQNEIHTKFEAWMSIENQKLLMEFKEFYAHDLKDFSDLSILEFLLQKAVSFKKIKLGLDKSENKSLKNASSTMTEEIKSSAAKPSTSKAVSSVQNEKTEIEPKSRTSIAKVKPQRQYISIHVKREIWRRAQGCCEHVDPNSKIRCASRFALQFDHVLAVALGGTNEKENLQLLCRAHNSRRSIQTFGKFTNAPPPRAKR